MNLCVIAGRIVRNATVKGTDRKILRFTVETRDGHDEGETKERSSSVAVSVLRLPERQQPDSLSAEELLGLIEQPRTMEGAAA